MAFLQKQAESGPLRCSKRGTSRSNPEMSSELWEGGRRSPIAAFGEFCKIIFVKHKDEKNPDREDGKP
jgi:hypothetical protein